MGFDAAGVGTSRRSRQSKSFCSRAVGAALENLGNTCFLNAVLQCLTHTVLFVQKIRDLDHSCPPSGFCCFCALKEHVNRSLFFSGSIVEPTEFAENLSVEISSDFEFGQQEDAHEFLQSLLNKIHTSSIGLSANDWVHSQQSDSLVKQVFGGSLRSELRCCCCGHHSYTFEPLLDLSLEIKNADNLVDALSSFTKVEKMDDPGVKITCRGCQSQVPMEKELQLDRAPEVLILHLKRFKNDGDATYKIHKPVEYPLGLDLKPFLSQFPSDEVQSKYDLYAYWCTLVHCIRDIISASSVPPAICGTGLMMPR